MSLFGVPAIYGINPYSTDTRTVPEHNLGALGFTDDGRTYRYSQAAGTALVTANLQVAADIETQHEDLAVNTFAVGDKTITVTLGSTAITGNEYQEGFVNVIDQLGEGIMYGIKSAPATALSTDVIILLDHPIVVAAEATTTVTLVRNKYRDIVISDTTQADLPVGVTQVAWSANEFGFLQTGGFASILVDSNDTVAGQPITIGGAVNGAVETHNAATEVTVGMQPVGANSDAGEHGAYILTLD